MSDKSYRAETPEQRQRRSIKKQQILTRASQQKAALYRDVLDDPFSMETLSELSQYLRFDRGVHAEDRSWMISDLHPFGLTKAAVRSVESLAAVRDSSLTSPLNIAYVFALPKLAEWYFAHHASPPTDTQQKLQEHFWALAWDYTHATLEAFDRGKIRVQSYQNYGVASATDLRAGLVSVRQQVMKYSPGVQPWSAAHSPYRDFIGEIKKPAVEAAPKRLRLNPSHQLHRWGRQFTSETSMQQKPKVARTLARKALDQSHFPQALAIDRFTQLQKYVRLMLMQDGKLEWSREACGRELGLGAITMEAVEEEYTIHPRTLRMHSPLNLRYLMKLEELGERIFATDPRPDWMTPELEEHFWKLARDYAHACVTGVRVGRVFSQHFQKTHGVYGHEAVLAKAEAVRAQIDARVERSYGVQPAWDAQTSGYKDFLGKRVKLQPLQYVVDRALQPPASEAEAEFFGDYLWHVSAKHGLDGAIMDTIGVKETMLNAIFGRITGHSAEAQHQGKRLGELGGYSSQLLDHLPSMFAMLKRELPAAEFTPEHQARFWCLAEEYAYAALDYAYDEKRSLRTGRKEMQDLANAVTEVTIPQAMERLAKEHPLACAKVAMAEDNQLLLSIASDEVRRLRRGGQLDEHALRQAVPQLQRLAHSDEDRAASRA